MSHTRTRLAGVALAGALFLLPACDTDPAERVRPDPQGPADQAPGTEGPDTQAETPAED